MTRSMRRQLRRTKSLPLLLSTITPKMISKMLSLKKRRESNRRRLLRKKKKSSIYSGLVMKKMLMLRKLSKRQLKLRKSLRRPLLLPNLLSSGRLSLTMQILIWMHSAKRSFKMSRWMAQLGRLSSSQNQLHSESRRSSLVLPQKTQRSPLTISKRRLKIWRKYNRLTSQRSTSFEKKCEQRNKHSVLR